MKYELHFDDWAVEHTPYHVRFKSKDKDGVEVTPYDWDADGNVIAVKYYKYNVRIAWSDEPTRDDEYKYTKEHAQLWNDVYKDMQKHTELWECHEQYKRRIW